MLASDLTVSFRGIEHSDAVETRIREEAAKLDRVFERVTAGTVTVEKPHRHMGRNQHFSVHIYLKVPSVGDVVVSQEPGRDDDHDDVYKTIRAAFAAARRQLKGRVEKMKGKVKQHAGETEDVAAGTRTV